MLAEGSTPAEAVEALGPQLSSQRRLFAIATGLREVADPNVPQPDPAFRDALAARLRSTEVAATLETTARPHHRFALVPLAAAACILLFAALLVPAMRSLPGDRLYGLKGFSEDARLVFASGAMEARVRVDLADERFSEVERLIARSSVQALPGTFAADARDISDPQVGQLIEDALLEAGRHLEAAVDILTSQPSQGADLDELVEVSRRGHELATQVADDLSNPVNPPVLSTVVKLAKIEAAAKAARTNVGAEPTAPPCDTPTPSPEPTATPGAGESETAGQDGGPTATPTPTASGSPEPTPTDTPEPTPCTTPEPTPTPTPTVEPEPTAEPTATPDVQEGVEGDDGSDSADAGTDGQTEQASAAEPSDA
jgi:hypothetical protein